MIIKNLREQLRDERRKNEALTAELNQAKAHLEYIVMMTDVEIEGDNDTEESIETDGGIE